MKKVLFYFVLFTWDIIQTLIGFILFLINIHKEHELYKGAIVTSWNFTGSVSLGAFLFIYNKDNNKEELLRHEYGHTIQSLILGPFWIFIIGLPSLIWCSCFKWYRKKHGVSYYSFYTESWANKLAKKYLK